MTEPVVGQHYVTRNTAPSGWRNESVRVVALSAIQRTAKVEDMDELYPGDEPYSTIVSWDDLILESSE